MTHHIMLSTKSIKVICPQTRITIFPENLALRGTAAYTSTVYMGYGPILAKDGNTNGTFTGGSCFHTTPQDVDNWWQVRLEKVSLISEVNIFNRVGAQPGYYKAVNMIDNVKILQYMKRDSIVEGVEE